MLNMVQPVNWLSELNHGLLMHCICLPGLMGGNRLVDLVKPARSGTLLGGASFNGATIRPGGFGSILNDGTDDYTGFTPFTIPTAQGSLSLWHCPLENQETTAHPLFSAEISTTNLFNFYPFSDGNTYGGWYSSAGGGDDRVKINTPAATIGTWHHWYLTWINGGVGNIYYDGTLITPSLQPTIGVTFDTATSDVMYLARSGTAYASCRIDDIRISSTIHDPKKIIAAGLGGYERELHWYRPRVYAPEQAAVTAYPWHYYQQMRAMAG